MFSGFINNHLYYTSLAGGMAVLMGGLGADACTAQQTIALLAWLCTGEDLSEIMRQRNTAAVSHMSGLESLSELLLPAMVENVDAKHIMFMGMCSNCADASSHL